MPRLSSPCRQSPTKFSLILLSATMVAAQTTAHQSMSSCFIKPTQPEGTRLRSQNRLLVSVSNLNTSFKDKNFCLESKGDDTHPSTGHEHYMQYKTQPNMKQVQAWITSIQSNFDINSYLLRLNCKGLNFPERWEACSGALQ